MTISILNYCFSYKNKGQWNAKSGPKVADGNVAMRTKVSGRLESKLERAAEIAPILHTHAAKLVVEMRQLFCAFLQWKQLNQMEPRGFYISGILGTFSKHFWMIT